MAGNIGTTVLRAARPGINLAGQDSPALAQGLLSLLVVETLSGLYRCEATVGNWGTVGNRVGFLFFDRKTLDFGKAFKVQLGTDALFDGRVLGLEAQFPAGRAPELTVLAEDRFQDLRMTRRTRTFANVSDADVINQVAGEHGLNPRVDVTGPTYKVLAQVNQSDLAFLRQRARAIDAELWMEGGALNARSHTGRAGSPLTLTYQGGLRAFSVLADLAGQRSSVIVSGWDVLGKSALRHEATDAVLGGELNGGRSGASILAAALGPRKESLAHTVPLASEEARALAEAFFKMSARRFVRGHGAAETDARLRVGGSVNLLGLGPLFSGTYYLTEVKHLFDGVNGLRTEFTCERPGLGP
jgi:phage protein D